MSHPGDTDRLQHFSFDQAPARGQLVHLDASWARVLAAQDYPPVVQQLLGECLAATAILANLLKIDGRVSIQASGDGPVAWVMAECDQGDGLRAMARFDEDAVAAAQPDLDPAILALTGGPTVSPIRELIGAGRLAINIQSADLNQRGNVQQGLVPLEADSLAGCIEHYFAVSEQLPSRMWLSAAEGTAAGMLIQRLAAAPLAAEMKAVEAELAWQEITTLASTVTPAELRNDVFAALLGKLFAELAVRVYPKKSLEFRCTCSRTRTAAALQLMGQAEVDDILAEEGQVSVDCQFCGDRYIFNENDVADLWENDQK